MSPAKVKTRASRSRNGAVLAGSLLLHAAILAALGWPLAVRFADRSNDEDAIDVTLERAQRPARADARLVSTSPAPRQPARSATPAPSTAAPLPLAPTGSGATTGPPTSRPGFDLGAALRAGGFACAGVRNTMLTVEERARCQEKLGALALKAPALPAPIDPAKRAYYDAVAEAYRDPGQMIPLTARGAGGMFAEERSVHSGHGPRVGCSVKFGPNAGKAPKGPPNALRAGPCFIQAPTGSLTPEGDIRKPY